jgi:hypothetical protein
LYGLDLHEMSPFWGNRIENQARILAARLPLAQRLRFIRRACGIDSPFPALRVDA